MKKAKMVVIKKDNEKMEKKEMKMMKKGKKKC